MFKMKDGKGEDLDFLFDDENILFLYFVMMNKEKKSEQRKRSEDYRSVKEMSG